MFCGFVGGYQSFEGIYCLHPQFCAKYGGSMLVRNLMVHHIIGCHDRDDKTRTFTTLEIWNLIHVKSSFV